MIQYQKPCFGGQKLTMFFAHNYSSGMFKNLNNSGNHMRLLDISGIDTRNVWNMESMFSANAYLIKHLNLGDINTKKSK